MSIQTEPSAARTSAAATDTRFSPVTRVSGLLAVDATPDFGSRTVGDAALVTTAFRGYENILAGRDARDAVFVSSRACGVCGSAHALASSLAMDMACGVQPPPMAVVVRNFLAATECLYDHPTHLFGRAGPDFSEAIVRETSPELWKRAEGTRAPRVGYHGYATVAEIMAALTPYSGIAHRTALAMSRIAREAFVLLGGKYPHPQTTTPGGLSATVDTQDLNLAYLRVTRFFDYGRQVVALWDDLTDFMLEADPRYAEVGAAPINLLDLGLWDDPYAYDGSIENASMWGGQRWSTPGAIVDGKLQTTDLLQLDVGIEEFVDRSFYDEWGSGMFAIDPVGNPLSERHPYNKRTIPQPGRVDTQGRYSWSTAARWNGHPMETGPHARLWISALAASQPHTRFIETTGSSVRLHVPSGNMPAGTVEWRVPDRLNALERNRARAYALLHAAVVAYENVVIALDLARSRGSDARIFTPYEIPRDHVVGAGYWGGGRGAITHHLQIDGRVIDNYQIIGPSTFSGSPRDGAGTPGPCETAIAATPLVTADPGERGIDVLRAIRSFDLCMFCASH
jgi:hydrogenase large subunit